MCTRFKTIERIQPMEPIICMGFTKENGKPFGFIIKLTIKFTFTIKLHFHNMPCNLQNNITSTA